MKELDAFGYPVSLKYEKHQEFRSAVGGAVTLAVFFGLAAFFGILLTRIITNETVKVESYLERINQVTDTNRNLLLTRDNFDFGMYVGYIGDNQTIGDNLHRYVSYSLSTIDYQIIADAEEQKREGASYYWK